MLQTGRQAGQAEAVRGEGWLLGHGQLQREVHRLGRQVSTGRSLQGVRRCWARCRSKHRRCRSGLLLQRARTTLWSVNASLKMSLYSIENINDIQGGPKKVSHYRESSLNRIENRQPG